MARTDLLTAVSPDAAQQALYGASWDRARALAAEGYRATLEHVPVPLQAIWEHQRDSLRPFGLDVAEMLPCRPDGIRRHALWAAYKAADAVKLL